MNSGMPTLCGSRRRGGSCRRIARHVRRGIGQLAAHDAGGRSPGVRDGMSRIEDMHHLDAPEKGKRHAEAVLTVKFLSL